jgi:2-isopropylmalate synthase
MSQDETIRRAIEATRLVRDLSDSTGTPVQYQYSPESFTGTEREFARDICNAVIDAWEPKPERKIIINLPATVEMSYPKVFADQIEWMSRNLKSRDSVIVSVHTHNDRGCAVAATEFGLMAGAERVEGTLFGNGERAGNADLVVLALNLYTQGIDPELCFRNLPEIRALYEECTGLSVPDRHPYAGDAAPIAFSGTHQVAIRKSLEYREASGDPRWNVAYLPIDFNDVGLSYTPIVINSQSGKNGTAFVLNSQFGLQIPKEMEGEVSAVVQRWCEQHGTSISPDTMMELFNREFVGRSGPIELHGYSNTSAFTGGQESHSDLTLRINGQVMQAHGLGNGPIDAAVNALANANHPLKVLSFSEHSLSAGSEASAIAYVQVECRGVSRFGVGVNTNSERASIEALISALNRTLKV